MNITRSFELAIDKMVKRNWQKIYVLVDIHDTVFEACYHDEETHKWFPYAKQTLELMTNIENISLILWTSTYPNIIKEYLDFFEENHIVFNHVNVNEEEGNTSLCCFDEKPYFNVGIDDKFGFDPNEDWKEVYDYLVEKIRLGQLK